ncbi:MAG: TonB-dependent receptor [Flavobacteriaceae bacterium]|jgi:iron complex outermembrane recepter protein|nr:TonB-dependent receptor [Flavobacteriaceae bacterium]MBT4113245.1 TonB-dependent receptor [Flavobacteriaceae bacterium]MBT4614643.1 TonB-dependent receptor [Flavobacteriaceae bacterium]MBT5247126.1 TonB-dependent receptor [Flavobacteriaceae bacterium]MBT5649612.1 TonB-dependent receptor [Flavobacteriaceae bacterium]
MKKITQNSLVALVFLFSLAIVSQEGDDSSDDSLSLQELEEVVVTGGGVIDLAEDRNTPVATSTIKGSEIQKKIGTQDITMTLVNTPSVYVSGQGGGFGDTRIAVRGFEQDNTAYMLNGQPINGMEDGKMYWSNWSGMNDVASVVQIQRGLGASKLAISSVGGTVNFVMKSTDKKEGGFAYAGFANDNYLKATYSYDTGKKGKWATSFLMSHWQGDGYNEGTFGQGQTYFLSVGYDVNDKHSLNFLMTGAPQWHDQNFGKSLSSYLEYGRKYNNNWGTYGDTYMTERRNFYHKPVFNLNWDWNIDDSSSLNTVLYASTGNGGGTGGRGYRPRTDRGNVDYDAIYGYNLATSGAGGNYAAEGGYVTRASMNMHNWVGMVMKYEKVFSDNLTFNVGADLRTYYGEHFRIVENFHGLTSWQENIRLRNQNDNHQTYGSYGTYKNVITARDMAANPWYATFADFNEDEKIAYSNDERISYAGIFAQVEYTSDNFSTFFQGAVSNQSHQRFDHYQYADQTLIDGTSSQGTGALPGGIEDGVDSEKVSNVGYNAKTGVAWDLGADGTVFVNAGYYSRQPYHDNIYLNFTNQVNPLTSNETILGLEAGYSYSSPNFSTNVNVYRTSWADRVVTSFNVQDDVVTFTTNEGVEQLHQGIEVDFRAKPQPDVPYTLTGFVSIGDWKYVGEAISRVTDEDQNLLDTFSNDVDGGEVGDAAQFTAGLGIDLQIAERFSMDSDVRFYDNLYADVGAVKENLKVPSYHVVDFGMSYKMYVGDDGDSLNFRLNINNLFDRVYINELRTNIAAEAGDTTWNGVNVANQGYFGMGRTWNVGLRYKF